MILKKNFILILLCIVVTTIAKSQENYCLNFDGFDDYISFDDINDLGTSDFTIEAWIYLDNSSVDVGRIVSKGLTSVGTPSNAGYSLRAQKDAIDEIELIIGNSDGALQSVTHNGISVGTWNHIAGVREGLKLSLYLNGELVNEEMTETIYNVDTDRALSIGVLDRGVSLDGFFHGKMDEVRIWNVSRTIEEIQEDMDCALVLPHSGLAAVYNLNESTGDSAIDASGFDNNGALIGQPVIELSDVAPICMQSSINEITINQLNLFPNPVGSSVNLPEQFRGLQIEIVDLSGRVVISNIINTNEVSVNYLSKGLYFIRIIEKDEHHIGKIIKM